MNRSPESIGTYTPRRALVEGGLFFIFPDMDMPPSSTFKLPSSAFDPPRDDWHASGVRADRQRSFAAIMERRTNLNHQQVSTTTLTRSPNLHQTRRLDTGAQAGGDEVLVGTCGVDSHGVPHAADVVHVAVNGVDAPSCGPHGSPCATLSYAVNYIANAVQPGDATVDVVIGSGVYGEQACGAHAHRPLNVSGAGSGVTKVDCGGRQRLLMTNDSLALSGLTVMGGYAHAAVGFSDVSYGGGAVAAVWPDSHHGAIANLSDLVFLENTAVFTLERQEGTQAGNLNVGGGAVLILGGGQGPCVTITGCSFINNSVLASGSVESVRVESFSSGSESESSGSESESTGSEYSLRFFGGAAYIDLGWWNGEASASATVIIDHVEVIGNWINCEFPDTGSCSVPQLEEALFGASAIHWQVD